MSYESRAYDEPARDGFGPDPVVVLVVKGTHDVSRFVHLLNGASPTCEQLQLGGDVAAKVRRDQGGRAALRLLAAHGGSDFTPRLPGVNDGQVEVVRRLAAGATVGQIATALQLSQTAVSMRIKRACDATGARGREQLVALCVHAGVVNPGALLGGSPRDGAR